MTCNGNWLVANATTPAMFQNAMLHILAQQRVPQLDSVLEKDLAGHAFMTIMKILFTDAFPHGVMMPDIAAMFMENHMPVKSATAVRELKVIQMADRYVLVAVVQVLLGIAYLVADHVPQDLHVAGFFQMMCV